MERGDFLTFPEVEVDSEVDSVEGARVKISEAVEVKMWEVDRSKEEGTSIEAVRVYSPPAMNSSCLMPQKRSTRVISAVDSRPDSEG